MSDETQLTRQVSLDFAARTHGGARAGAGRPRTPEGERTFIVHRARPVHRKGDPVHVTMRVKRGLPSLRKQLLVHVINRCMLAQRRKLALEGKSHFQLVEFSVQTDHLHLIVEAPDKRGLARGLMGLAIRITRRINKLIGRKGRFWADRYQCHDLRTPTETRNAIRYVLLNLKKHARVHARVFGEPVADPYSSASTFPGFVYAPKVLATAMRWPPVAPTTWLLRSGWRLHGLVDPADAPWSRLAA